MENLRIAKVKIQNIMAIRELEFSPDTVTILEGGNATGKSSVIRALDLMFQRGHDADLILDPIRLPIPPYPAECRKWKKPRSGKVEITLSDGSTLIATVRAKNTLRDWFSATGEKLGGSDKIRELVTGIALDPGRFIDPVGSKAEKEKARLDFLLDVLPVDIPIEKVREFIPDVLGPVDLARIDSHIEGFATKRTGINQQVALLDKSTQQLERLLPEDDETDWAAAAEEAQGKVTDARSVLDGLAKDRDVLVRAEQNEIEKRCEENIAGLQTQIAAFKEQRVRKSAEMQERAQRLYEGKAREHEQSLQDLRETLGTARERAAGQERAAGIREQIALNRKDWALEARRSGDLTEQIEGLRGLRKDALSDLPIEGLDIRGGRVFVDDTPIEHLNDSDRLLIALQIATQGDNLLRFVYLEHSEFLEEDRFRRAVETLNKTGDVQVVLHRVSGAPELEVVVAGAPE